MELNFLCLFSPKQKKKGKQKAESNKGAQLWQSCTTRDSFPVPEKLSSMGKLAGFAFLVLETWVNRNSSGPHQAEFPVGPKHTPASPAGMDCFSFH